MISKKAPKLLKIVSSINTTSNPIMPSVVNWFVCNRCKIVPSFTFWYVLKGEDFTSPPNNGYYIMLFVFTKLIFY